MVIVTKSAIWTRIAGAMADNGASSPLTDGSKHLPELPVTDGHKTLLYVRQFFVAGKITGRLECCLLFNGICLSPRRSDYLPGLACVTERCDCRFSDRIQPRRVQHNVTGDRIPSSRRSPPLLSGMSGFVSLIIPSAKRVDCMGYKPF